jgi:hypothetical protein
MIRRRWGWLGKLVSDEGFEIYFGHKSVSYSDTRGTFEFGFEDGMLSATPCRVAGTSVPLNQCEVDQMVERVVEGIQEDGGKVEVFSSRR